MCLIPFNHNDNSVNGSQIPIVQLRKQRLRDLSHLPKISPSPFCSEPELLAVDPLGVPEPGPWRLLQAPAEWGVSPQEDPSVISSNSAYHTAFSQVEYPGNNTLNGVNGMEPTERKPNEV